jgi:hypothetical protein
VPIGETLAEARRQAGLTVTQVSERTRIRETIIRGVEDDDYSSCGGDFYTRGNIRAIAKVIGTDSGPLIREYDAVHRAPGALSTVSRDELLATSVRVPQRRRPDLSTVCELVAAAYRSVRQRVNLAAVRDLVASAYPAVRRRPRSTVVLGLALVVVLGFGVDRFLSGSQHAAVAPVGCGNPVSGCSPAVSRVCLSGALVLVDQVVDDLAACEPGLVEFCECRYRWWLGWSPVPCPMRPVLVIVPFVLG